MLWEPKGNMDFADHVFAALKAAVEDFGKVRGRVKDPRTAALLEGKMRFLGRRIQETERELRRIEMKKFVIAAFALWAFPASVPRPCHALGGNGKGFVAFDLFLPGNGGDDFFNDVQKEADILRNMGYTSAYSAQAVRALGGRGGFLFAVNEKFKAGPSVGFVAGPNASASMLLTGGGLSGTLTATRDVSYFRTLIEQRLSVPLGEKFSFDLGGGFGMAYGAVKVKVHCVGSACLSSGSTNSESSSWSGLSWEISPGFSAGDFFFAYRYAGFPPFKGTDGLSPINWTTSGFTTGWAF